MFEAMLDAGSLVMLDGDWLVMSDAGWLVEMAGCDWWRMSCTQWSRDLGATSAREILIVESELLEI